MTIRSAKSVREVKAIRNHVDLNKHQIAEIKTALEEADHDDFASEREIRNITKKWTTVQKKSPQSK